MRLQADRKRAEVNGNPVSRGKKYDAITELMYIYVELRTAALCGRGILRTRYIMRGGRIRTQFVICIDRVNNKMGKNKKIMCKVCYKEMRSDNLNRHLKQHSEKDTNNPATNIYDVGHHPKYIVFSHFTLKFLSH